MQIKFNINVVLELDEVKQNVNLSVSSGELRKSSARGAMAAFSSFSEMPNVGRWLCRTSTCGECVTGSTTDDEALMSCDPARY